MIEVVAPLIIGFYLWVTIMVWIAYRTAMSGARRDQFPAWQLEKNALLWLPILVLAVGALIWLMILVPIWRLGKMLLRVN